VHGPNYPSNRRIPNQRVEKTKEDNMANEPAKTNLNNPPSKETLRKMIASGKSVPSKASAK
jgi:hypothetical protein